MQAEIRHGLLLLGVAATDNGPELGGGFKKFGSFAAIGCHVTLFTGVGVAAVEQLHHLTFSNGVGGVGHDFHDSHIIEGDHHLEGA